MYDGTDKIYWYLDGTIIQTVHIIDNSVINHIHIF